MRSMLGESWIAASVALVLVGIAVGSAPIIGLAALVFTTGGAARLWSRLSLEDVRYERTLSEQRAFAGETIDARLTLHNAKWLPVPWVEVREQLPQAMPLVAGRTQPSGMQGIVYLLRQTGLSGGERVGWPFRLQARERGYYRVGPTRLRSGDIFGLFEREATVAQPAHIVVYPRTVPLPALGLPAARPFGERRGGQRIYEDPLLIAGARDYIPGDPLKRIDWKASARSGRLQSRQYEPSHTQSIVIALNVSTMEHSWQGQDPVALERSVVVAASVARWAFEEDLAVGLIANGSFPDADRPIRIGSGRRPDQLVHVLEALAMVTGFSTSPLAAELQQRGHALPAGATLVVVTALMPPELLATLHRLRADGHAVHVVRTGEQPWPDAVAPIHVHEVVSYMRALEAEYTAGASAPGESREVPV